jgi:hypothetical protein
MGVLDVSEALIGSRTLAAVYRSEIISARLSIECAVNYTNN